MCHMVAEPGLRSCHDVTRAVSSTAGDAKVDASTNHRNRQRTDALGKNGAATSVGNADPGRTFRDVGTHSGHDNAWSEWTLKFRLSVVESDADLFRALEIAEKIGRRGEQAGGREKECEWTGQRRNGLMAKHVFIPSKHHKHVF